LKIQKLFFKNSINVFLLLCPFIGFAIFAIIYGDKLLLLISCLCLVVFCVPAIPIIVTNIKILLDIINKTKIQKNCEVIRIDSAWPISSIGIKRKYITNILKKNYICIYKIFLKYNNKIITAYFYIKINDLMKLNFFNIYKLSYTYKKEWILPIYAQLIINADIIFNRFSKIIDKIEFVPRNNKIDHTFSEFQLTK